MRKILFAVLILLVFLGLLGPAIYAKKINKSNVSPPATIETAAPLGPAGNSSPERGGGIVDAETALPAQPSSGTPQAEVAQKDEGLSGPGSPPASEKSPPPLSTAAYGNETAAVSVAVVGKDGVVLYGPAEVRLTKKNRWDITALGALDATGLPYEVSARWAGLVESVAGQRNKGQAGWMYKVNGEIPMVAADRKTLAAGDKVIWWYSRSIDDPTPNWQGLFKNN